MQTCGKGLADRSWLPSKLAEITAALSRVMELHQRGIVASDTSQPELDAYASLEHQFRSASNVLSSSARDMSGYRDLPMAEHDMTALSTPENVNAFAEFVRVERELLNELDAALHRDEAMLAQMPR